MKGLQCRALLGLICLSWNWTIGASKDPPKISSTTEFVPYKYFIEVKKKFNDETHPKHPKYKPWDKDELTEDQKRRLIALDIKKKVEVYVEEGNEEHAYDHKGHDKHEKGFEDHETNHRPPHSNAEPQASEYKPHRINPPSSTIRIESKRPPVPVLRQKINPTRVNMLSNDFLQRRNIPPADLTMQNEETVVCAEPFRREFPGPKDPALQRPRIQGVGDTIECLRVKYFGANPLDDRIFEQLNRYYP